MEQREDLSSALEMTVILGGSGGDEPGGQGIGTCGADRADTRYGPYLPEGWLRMQAMVNPLTSIRIQEAKVRHDASKMQETAGHRGGASA